jgi:hypothetical protein
VVESVGVEESGAGVVRVTLVEVMEIQREVAGSQTRKEEVMVADWGRLVSLGKRVGVRREGEEEVGGTAGGEGAKATRRWRWEGAGKGLGCRRRGQPL